MGEQFSNDVHQEEAPKTEEVPREEIPKEEEKKENTFESESKYEKESNSGFDYERYIYQTLRKYPLFAYMEDSAKAQVSRLSELSIKSFESLAQKSCSCLNENSDILGSTLTEIKSIFSNSNEAVDKKQLLKSVKKLQAFLLCFENVNLSENAEAVKNDLKKISGNVTEEQMNSKQLEMVYYNVGKSCPNSRNMFRDFLTLNKRIIETIK